MGQWRHVGWGCRVCERCACECCVCVCECCVSECCACKCCARGCCVSVSVSVSGCLGVCVSVCSARQPRLWGAGSWGMHNFVQPELSHHPLFPVGRPLSCQGTCPQALSCGLCLQPGAAPVLDCIWGRMSCSVTETSGNKFRKLACPAFRTLHGSQPKVRTACRGKPSRAVVGGHWLVG